MSQSPGPDSQPSPTEFDVPRSAGLMGLSLVLAALGMLFAASIVGYVTIRLTGSNAPPLRTLHIPRAFWLSTLFMLASTMILHHAYSVVRAGRWDEFRVRITIAAILAIAFLAIQAPSMYQLYLTHQRVSKTQNVSLYGLAMVLIALHAAHVVGGMIPLFKIALRSMGGKPIAVDYRSVQYCAIYWHFLDVVWITMFAVLLITG